MTLLRDELIKILKKLLAQQLDLDDQGDQESIALLRDTIARLQNEAP